jgi:threonylcarbamoyladenosine tRNA methylthiotransferase MtaB
VDFGGVGALKKVSFVTLGCKVNQYDTASVIEKLPKGEFISVPFPEKADYYVINTCTVTEKADAEARRYIRRARRLNPNGIVIVTGCYAQVSPGELEKERDVDYVIGNADKLLVVAAIEEGRRQANPKIIVSDVFRQREFESPPLTSFPERTRAFLKIQDGCNYRCTFCIIPFARGRSRSLPVAEVVKRMERLRIAGYKEVVLTGIHLSSYGRDIGTNLLRLLSEIESSGVMPRVRLSSLDPADTNEDLIDFVASSNVVCPSLHVALQSGDAGVLRRMRRRYKPEEFLRLTHLIRERIPDAAIGTDIMVGFPGETEEEFLNSLEVLKASALTYFHVFPYSKRRGTPAAQMPCQVDSETVKRRSDVLRTLGREKKIRFFEGFIGRSLSVLIERGSRGTTPNYIPVRVTDGNFKPGDETMVRITGVRGEEALGVPMS